MKITILNGNPDANNTEFDDYLTKLTDLLAAKNHTVKVLQIREMDVRYCIGCFGCWMKTPGECSNTADDSRVVRREYINSELVIFASPVIMGFTSALLKTVHDKLIPLLTPYVRLFDGETHHVARYDTYPLIAVLLQPDNNTDSEDVNIISEIYQRDAINFKTSCIFTRTTESPVEELVDAVTGI